jgi:hypothetical protein
MMPVPMVGRAGERAELDAAWSALATTGRRAPTVTVITGVAGVGKSLLVGAALDSFTPAPSVVLSGAARVHSPAPYDRRPAGVAGRCRWAAGQRRGYRSSRLAATSSSPTAV